MDEFLAQLARTIRSQRLLPRGRPLLLGVSGGLDSIVLLHALAELQADFGWRLRVAHFNHHLRPRAAAADERFVAKVCRRLGIPCEVGHWSAVEKAAAIRKGGVEKAARDARRNFFGMTAAKLETHDLVLAQHADDQLETFFLRLFRGAGLQGLGGIRARTRQGPPLNCRVIRPLLEFRREELAAWAATRGIAHRTDASNAGSRFARNRVRHELLPLLTSRFSPRLATILPRTMRLLADDADCLRQLAEAYLGANPTPATFLAAHPALQRHILIRQLERLGAEFDANAVEQLRAQPESWITLPGASIVARNADGILRRRPRPQAVFVAPADLPLDLRQSPGRVRLTEATISWRIRSAAGKIRFQSGREYFDADVVGATATLRTWRAGDRFQPTGMPRPVKLKDLFTNAGIHRSRRSRLLVATSGDGRIFWVEGLRMSEPFKLTSGTRRILVWSWTRAPATGQETAPLQPANRKSRRK